MRISDWSSDVCSSDLPIEIDEAGDLVPGEVACAHLEPAPGTEIDPKSLEVTGIVLDHPFRMAKPEREALDHVFAPVRAAVRKYECQRAILVGHNAHFDLNFLNAAVARVAHKRNPFHPFSVFDTVTLARSEEHTSELQSLMRISYAAFCLKKKQHQ